MRYDTAVYFMRRGDEVYDPETGDYGSAKDGRNMRMASVMDTSEKMLTLVYGKLREGSLTIQLQNAYDRAFDYIKVNGRKYAVDYQRRLRMKHTFVVSEVQ